MEVHGSCTRKADLDRTRPSPGTAAVGFGGGVRAGPGAVPVPVEGPMFGDEDRGVTVPGVMCGREPRWEPRGRTTFQFSGLT